MMAPSPAAHRLPPPAFRLPPCSSASSRQSAAGSCSCSTSTLNSSCIIRRASDASTRMCVAAVSDSRMASRTTVRTGVAVERAPLHAVLQLHDGHRVGIHRVGLAVRDGEPVPEAGRVVRLAAPDRLLHVARPVGPPGAVEKVDRRLDRLFLRAAVRARRAPARARSAAAGRQCARSSSICSTSRAVGASIARSTSARHAAADSPLSSAFVAAISGGGTLSSSKPRPTSTGRKRACPPISPHSPTQRPRAWASETMRSSRRRNDGSSGFASGASRGLPLSHARKYCSRSFVPTLKKSSAPASGPIRNAADGTSIMAPTGMPRVERHAGRRQAGLLVRDHLAHPGHLVEAGDHRDHHLQAPERGRADERADL